MSHRLLTVAAALAAVVLVALLASRVWILRMRPKPAATKTSQPLLDLPVALE